MKTMKTLVLLGLFLFAVGCGEEEPGDNPATNPSPTLMQPAARTPGEAAAALSAVVAAAASDAVPSNADCPVTGEPVDKTGIKLSYAGKVVGFCCDDCVKPFKKDPAKYAPAIH
jgi:YHS domain-containing protein